ncbi:MAG: hypothetical protein J6X02_00680 [Bacilli bacterium]|nr:hypothetical protein [Bacilli bacterium]
MKKYLLAGIIGLLLLTGCGKKADIVCTTSMDYSGITMDRTYYGYLTDGKISKFESEVIVSDEGTAQLLCTALQQEEVLGTKVECDGKKVTTVNESGGEYAKQSKAEFVKAAEAEGMTCK